LKTWDASFVCVTKVNEFPSLHILLFYRLVEKSAWFFLGHLITFFHHLKSLQRFSFGWVMDRINQVKIPLLYCSVRMEVRNATGLRMYVLQWSVEGVKQMRGEIHLSLFSLNNHTRLPPYFLSQPLLDFCCAKIWL
jgi:hypothetical protein